MQAHEQASTTNPPASAEWKNELADNTAPGKGYGPLWLNGRPVEHSGELVWLSRQTARAIARALELPFKEV